MRPLVRQGCILYGSILLGMPAYAQVMVKWSWKGTNTVSFNGFPATNKEVNHHAMIIYQFSGGKIAQASMESARLGFFQQIGVISPSAIAPPAKK